jgi:hypothetical protein
MGAVRGMQFSWFWFVLESGGTSLSAITRSARPGLPGALERLPKVEGAIEGEH